MNQIESLEERLQKLHRQFARLFGRSAEVAVRAPGRVNLIGEHTDYNEGFVLPVAIERSTIVLAAPRDDEKLVIYSNQLQQQGRFQLQPNPPESELRWLNYCIGVAAGLMEAGIPLRGGELLLDSTIPIGGGLSSSAALEVATAKTLLALAAGTMDEQTLALLCQQAEHRYAHMPCGIMDQFICVLGKKDHALLLDCRDRSYEHIPISDPQVSIVIADTGVRHELADSEYPLRRKQCAEAVAALRRHVPSVRSLRDATMQMLERFGNEMNPTVLRRARHVVRENERTVRAARSLQKNDYQSCGELMNQSHDSLRDDYQVSCRQLDEMVDIARSVEGVYGSRMTGGGFGGCTVTLCREDAIEKLLASMRRRYQQTFDIAPRIFVTRAANGAELLSSK